MTTRLPRPVRVADGIYSVDVDYLRPGLAASHILVEAGEAAFVDTGTNSSVPGLLAALDELGIAGAAVRYVFLTHIHLDHAGGAGTLMQALPNAQCVVHPRGARHMVDPVKLMAGTRVVYGDALTTLLYGELVPIDADRVLEPADGEVLQLGSRRLEVFYTEGHARHHYCLHDPATRGVFTGDSFGISYRELDTEQGPFVFPTTTPVHFDPDAAHEAIEWILAREPDCVYLTHYSRVGDLGRLAADMHAHLDAFVRIAREHRHRDDREQAIERGLFDYLVGRVEAHGFKGDRDAIGTIINADMKLNAQGLVVWLTREEVKA